MWHPMNSDTENILRISGSEFFPKPDFRLAVVSKNMGSSRYGWNDYTYVPHCHDFSEMVLVTSGQGVQNINGVDFALQQGDLFLLDDQNAHFIQKSEDFSLLNLLFDRRTLGLPWNRFQRCKGYNLFFMVEPRLRTSKNFCNHLHLTIQQQKHLESMLLDMQQLLIHITPEKELLALARLIEIILYVSELNEEPSNPDNMLPKIGESVALLEKHFTRDFTLDELAEKACMSTRNFTRCFKRSTGMSPIAFLQNVRLQHAADLLKNSNSRISEIAYQCGFNDSNYFTKMFAMHYGVAPAMYRKLDGKPAAKNQVIREK